MASETLNENTNSMDLDPNPIIKEENYSDQLNAEESLLEIKAEHYVPSEESENPFRNINIDIKQEFLAPQVQSFTINQPYEMTISNFNESPNFIPKCDEEESQIVKTEEFSIEKPEIKEEVIGDDMVAFDYPNVEDDLRSMDSNEAAALTQVEACLQDEYSVKTEDEQFEDFQKEDYGKIDIKEESDFTVTETHLISNKLINTTSTVTNTHDGLISQTTNTLVMEILPVTQSNMHFHKTSDPEQILPTTYDNTSEYMDYQDSFHLNSITGNVLSLEQEAYGLLESKKTVNKHYKGHVTCPKCPKVYRDKGQMKRHLKVHESIENRARGVLQGLKTKMQKKNIKIKEEEDLSVEFEDKVKKEEYVCTCGQAFRRRSRLETCQRSHDMHCDTSTYPCVSCSKQFKDKQELAMHRKRLHRKRFPCKFCPTDYHTRKELFKHLQIHQKVQLMEYKVISEVVSGKGEQKLNCFMCSECYTDLSDLKCHVMEDHKEPYSCLKCKETFSEIIDFADHTKTSHPEVEGQSILDVLEAFSKLVKAWKCEECGLQFHEADKLAMHQIEQHSPELKAEPQFQCADCRRVFISQKGLTSHRRVHHATDSIEETVPLETGVMCLECRKMCKDMNALVSHMRFHSPDRKFPCKFCDFRFATPEKRKAHAEIHTGDMKYVCFICEYQCSSENRLKQHKLSLKHLNMKEFLLTGKPLTEDPQTSVSEKVKDTPKKERRKRKECKSEWECVQVACDICGDKFPSESEMLEHKQTHPFIEFPNEDTPSRIFFK